MSKYDWPEKSQRTLLGKRDSHGSMGLRRSLAKPSTRPT